jgi:type II secretory ATPase GspE/PulE/Tfp pilus assembly ATPase PilB-like protein
MTAELAHQILADPTEENLRAISRKQGMLTMKEDAIIKAFQGTIPLSEVNELGGMLLAEQVIEEKPSAAQSSV